MKRISIFKISFGDLAPGSRELGENLLKMPYSDRDGQGFLIEDIDEGAVTGSFFYRLTTTVVMFDPNGREIKQEQIRFSEFRFRYVQKGALIILFDAPRSLKILWAKMSSIFGYKFVVENYSIPLRNVVEFFGGLFSIEKIIVSGFRSEVEKFEITGILSSILENNLPILLKAIPESNLYGVECDLISYSTKCNISRSGCIRFRKELDSAIFEEILKHLTDA